MNLYLNLADGPGKSLGERIVQPVPGRANRNEMGRGGIKLAMLPLLSLLHLVALPLGALLDLLLLPARPLDVSV